MKTAKVSQQRKISLVLFAIGTILLGVSTFPLAVIGSKATLVLSAVKLGTPVTATIKITAYEYGKESGKFSWSGATPCTVEVPTTLDPTTGYYGVVASYDGQEQSVGMGPSEGQTLSYTFDFSKVGTYYLATGHDEGCTVTPAGGYYEPGTSVVLTAHVKEDYRFREWLLSDSTSRSESQIVLIMDRDWSATAYTTLVGPKGDGKVPTWVSAKTFLMSRPTLIPGIACIVLGSITFFGKSTILRRKH